MDFLNEMTNFPDPKYWIAASAAYALYGIDKNDRAALKRLSSNTVTMVMNGILDINEIQNYKRVRYIRKSAFDRAEVDAAFRYYVEREKQRNPKTPEPEEKPTATIVDVKKEEAYDTESEEMFDINNFAMNALLKSLEGWEEQVNCIVRRVSMITRGDNSGIQDILHYLHICVEKDAGVSLERLAGKESKISAIRKDVRLQYYFLREARFLALKNGIIHVEYI